MKNYKLKITLLNSKKKEISINKLISIIEIKQIET